MGSVGVQSRGRRGRSVGRWLGPGNMLSGSKTLADHVRLDEEGESNADGGDIGTAQEGVEVCLGLFVGVDLDFGGFQERVHGSLGPRVESGQVGILGDQLGDVL